MNDLMAFLGDHIFELISLGAVLGALGLAARQNTLAARAVRAQSFLNLHELEIESHAQEGVLAIATLKPYRSFAEFRAGEASETVETIYSTVAFLNFVATLGEVEYLNVQDAWNIYFWSYRIASEKLLTWWLDEYRRDHPHVFAGFERTCRVVGAISPQSIATFDKTLPARYQKLYQVAASLDRGTVRRALRQANESTIASTSMAGPTRPRSEV